MAAAEPNRRGPDRRGIDRRRQIVESASAVFAELGYRGGSVRIIADRYDTIFDEVSLHVREAIDAGDFHPMSAAQIDDETRRLFATMDGLQLQWLIDPRHRPRPHLQHLRPPGPRRWRA